MRKKLAGKVISYRSNYELTILNEEDQQEYYVILSEPVHLRVGMRIGFWAEVIANCAVVGEEKQPYLINQIKMKGLGPVRPFNP